MSYQSSFTLRDYIHFLESVLLKIKLGISSNIEMTKELKNLPIVI